MCQTLRASAGLLATCATNGSKTLSIANAKRRISTGFVTETNSSEIRADYFHGLVYILILVVS